MSAGLRKGALDLLLKSQSSAWSDASSGGAYAGGAAESQSGSAKAAGLVGDRVSIEVQSFKELTAQDGRPARWVPLHSAGSRRSVCAHCC